MAKRIYIDAGHGGVQPGATNGSRKESNDVLRMALKVAEYLKGQDCEVKLSRSTDVDVDINDRCNEANNWGADYFLSIHRNSAGASASGNEIWIYSKATDITKKKAENILYAVCKTDGLKNRGVHKGAPSYTDFGVNRLTNMHSALLELGFISNANDNKIYDSKLNAVALALAKILLSVVGYTWKEPVSTVKGDVNNDGKVTAADARTILQTAAGTAKLSGQPAKNADVNNDGKITAADARDTLRKSAGLK